MFKTSIDVAAEPGVLFELSQDYGRRLEWDPFLREARLLGGLRARESASAPGAPRGSGRGWRRVTTRTIRRAPARSR